MNNLSKKYTEQTQLEYNCLNNINQARIASVENTALNKSSPARVIDVSTPHEPIFPGAFRTLKPIEANTVQNARQGVEPYLPDIQDPKASKVGNLYHVSPHTVENAQIIHVPGIDASENELRSFGSLVLRTTNPTLFHRNSANAAQAPYVESYNREISAMCRVLQNNRRDVRSDNIENLSLFRTAVRDSLTPVFERWHKFFLVLADQSPEYFAQMFNFFMSWDIGEFTGRTATAYFFRIIGLLIAYSPYIFTLFPTVDVFSNNILRLFYTIRKGAHRAWLTVQKKQSVSVIQRSAEVLYFSLERRARDFINRDAGSFATSIANNSLIFSRSSGLTWLSGVFLSVGTLSVGLFFIKNPILLEVLKKLFFKFN